ncbi:Cytochrome b-c1 complex subunit 7 [Folsomia candida]|uniref:Cytochrome b-c1 complex subunit 7 n=1 Tax=Folsomia candida TaxID=158441 RepID=A0A226EYB5_FOLCA|nr:Cytochrome b-c1 complex subunit 7 [Folsomia candida]
MVKIHGHVSQLLGAIGVDILDKSGFNAIELKLNNRFIYALRRLPANVVDERNFRIIRAMQLSMQKIYLPKEEWLTFEQDDYYLKPYLEEVEREFKEREEWRKT